MPSISRGPETCRRRGCIETVRVSGLPLGLFDDADYQETEIELHSGDVIVVCSDGLEDCLYEQGGQVTDGRLDAWVRRLSHRSAQEIAEELVLASEPTDSGEEPADDRTVVVMKVL